MAAAFLSDRGLAQNPKRRGLIRNFVRFPKNLRNYSLGGAAGFNSGNPVAGKGRKVRKNFFFQCIHD
jgi:hypothetical protein